MHLGPVPLGTTTYALVQQCVTDARAPVAADTNAVTYRIYAPSGTSALLTGSFSTTVVDSQTGFYQATGIQVTGANGFAAGNTYVVRVAYAVSAANKVDVHSFTVT